MLNSKKKKGAYERTNHFYHSGRSNQQGDGKASLLYLRNL